MLFDVWGELACFTRPEFAAERVSYEIITPSAARGIVESIYWHPGVRWEINKIYVLSPIQTMSVKRNEVGEKISARTVARNFGKKQFLDTGSCRQQRNSLLLKNVHYVIDASFTVLDGRDAKVYNITKRRLNKGACHQQPYFGCKEFEANFQEFHGQEKDILTPFSGIEDLGIMFYDFDYMDGKRTPLMFQAILRDGCLDLRDVSLFRSEKGVDACS